MKHILFYLILIFASMSCTPKKDGNTYVLIQTNMGDIKVKLYDETPKHRDNFIKLVNEGYYDGVLFHRVIKDFMIQSGDGDSKNAPAGKMLGMGDPGYKIPAEIVYPTYFHKRGALAAARQGDDVNPEKASSGSQFYIVTGTKFNEGQLDSMEVRMAQMHEKQVFDSLAVEHRAEIVQLRKARDQDGLYALQEKLIGEMKDIIAKQSSPKLTSEQREAYKSIGGTPHLDNEYTVFGEVVEGMEVVDRIQAVATGQADRPKKDVIVEKMKIED